MTAAISRETALADFLANFRESIVELEWTSPLSQRWPDVQATRANAGFGGGAITPRLADIVADQKSLWSTVAAEPRAFLDEYGPGGAPVTGQMTDAASLQPLLTATANAGRFPPAKGPLSWLEGELLCRNWLPGALEPAIKAVVAGGGTELLAFLDWASEECDLWRFVRVLEGLDGEASGLVVTISDRRRRRDGSHTFARPRGLASAPLAMSPRRLWRAHVNRRRLCRSSICNHVHRRGVDEPRRLESLRQPDEAQTRATGGATNVFYVA